MPLAERDTLTVYQAKCAAFLSWSQPFIYRLLKSLEPKVRQVVLTQRIENADLFPMPKIERLNSKTLFSPFQAHRAACRLQQKYHGDVIHAHFGTTALKVLVLKQLMRLPMVVTLGGRDLTVCAQRPATKAVFQSMFKTVEQFVAVSDDLRLRAIKMGCSPEKIVTIHRGVDTDEFAFVDRGDRRNQTVGILMVSRLVPKKGHVDAAGALAKLPPDACDWNLTILGEGPEEASLRQVLAKANLLKRTRFLGVVPIERVREEMSKADILLHPSVTGDDGDKEGLPNVIIEAQAMGLPVVSTEHGGIPEIIKHGETGLLVPEHDVNLLSNMLSKLITSRELRLRFGQAARRIVEQDFSLKQQGHRHMELYRALAERYPSGSPALGKISGDEQITGMLHESVSEARVAGDVSISEAFESWFIDADGDDDTAEPWWYGAFWRLKKYVPRGFKFRTKAILFRLFRKPFTRHRLRLRKWDEQVWQVLKTTGLPDPLAPAKTHAWFESVAQQGEGLHKDRKEVSSSESLRHSSVNEFRDN